MLSYEDSKNGIIVAVFDSKSHKNKSKYVFYDETKKNDKLTPDEEQELKKALYGYEKARTKERMKKLELNECANIFINPSNSHNEGAFIPFYPQTHNGDRTIIYITGRSGSGKSTLAKKLSWYFNKIMNVYILSPITDDEYHGTFLKLSDLVEVDTSNDYDIQKKEYEDAKIQLKYKRKELKRNPKDLVDLELFVNDLKPKRTTEKIYKFTDLYHKKIRKPSLFIYDDNEAEGDTEKLKFIMNSQLLTGRHDNISMIILNHHATSGGKTRNISNEAHCYVFFKPYNRFTEYYLKEYLQYDKFHIKKIRELLNDSRYVAVYKEMDLLLTENKVLKL